MPSRNHAGIFFCAPASLVRSHLVHQAVRQLVQQQLIQVALGGPGAAATYPAPARPPRRSAPRPAARRSRSASRPLPGPRGLGGHAPSRGSGTCPSVTSRGPARSRAVRTIAHVALVQEGVLQAEGAHLRLDGERPPVSRDAGPSAPRAQQQREHRDPARSPVAPTHLHAHLTPRSASATPCAPRPPRWPAPPPRGPAGRSRARARG